MILNVQLHKNDKTLKVGFDEMYEVSDGGYERGYEEGKRAGSDSFWDIYQQNGTRTLYENAFSSYGWTDETFKPKYDIKPANAVQMFKNSQITNLKKTLDDAGIVLDFSNCTTLQYTFQNAQITHIGVIDASKCSNLNYFMPGARAVYIEKLILKNDGSQTFMPAYSFSACSYIEHIIFEGVIGKNGLDLHWSTKLDANSLESIVNCLSTTTTGLTVTLPTTAQANYDAIYGEGAWAALVATRPNWTIAYL